MPIVSLCGPQLSECGDLEEAGGRGAAGCLGLEEEEEVQSGSGKLVEGTLEGQRGRLGGGLVPHLQAGVQP